MATSREVVRVAPTLDLQRSFNLPTSTAIRAGGFIFCSGLLATDSETGKPARGTAASETRIVLENIKKVLETAGSSLDRIVKVTVFLSDLADFPSVTDVFREFFPKDPPARTTVGAQVALGFKVEIECVASA